jgi:hypothetical protein
LRVTRIERRLDLIEEHSAPRASPRV